MSSFFIFWLGAPLSLHSFPTRRSSDLGVGGPRVLADARETTVELAACVGCPDDDAELRRAGDRPSVYRETLRRERRDRKSTRLNSSHRCISYAVFCLKKKNKADEVRMR